MQHAKIVRTQHPVGHGVFHTGHITTTEVSAAKLDSSAGPPTGAFSYFYDCGSEQSEAFNAELALHREQSGGETDILFVSHLHADHINGIDRLQGMALARKVVVNYLDEIGRLLFVLSDFDRGAVSRSSLDYFTDPVAWWFGRGVQQVIFLQPGGPNDVPPPRAVDPDFPLGDSGERRRALSLDDTDRTARLASRLNSHLKAPHGEEFEVLAPAETTRPEQKMALIAATGSYFQLECRTFADEDWHGADWILLPYVHPLDDPARKRFVKDLRGARPARRSGKAKLNAALLSRLSAMEQ